MINLKNTISLNGNQYSVEELVGQLSYLPAENIVDFFQTKQISVPRILRIRVLRRALRDEVIYTRQQLATLADETNYRLSWFRKFSEFELEGYLVEFNNRKIRLEYLDLLWLTLLDYLLERQVSPTDILQLVEKSKEYEVKPHDMAYYNWTLNKIFYDEVNKIDGLTPQQFRPVLYKSSTIPQIREIGLKYNVKVPKRLRKQELLDIVYDVLKERDQYSDELAEILRKKNIIQIQRFCIDNEIKASTELKKEEIIEYILRNAKETRKDYFLPTDHSAYDYEITDFDVEDDEQEIVEQEKEMLPEQFAEQERKQLEKETQEVAEVVEVVDEPVQEEIVEEVVQKPVVDKSVLLAHYYSRKEEFENRPENCTNESVEDFDKALQVALFALEDQNASQEDVDSILNHLVVKELVVEQPVEEEQVQEVVEKIVEEEQVQKVVEETVEECSCGEEETVEECSCGEEETCEEVCDEQCMCDVEEENQLEVIEKHHRCSCGLVEYVDYQLLANEEEFVYYEKPKKAAEVVEEPVQEEVIEQCACDDEQPCCGEDDKCEEDCRCDVEEECSCNHESEEQPAEEPVQEEVVEEQVQEIAEERKQREILEVNHIDFTNGGNKTIHIRKGNVLRPIYAPEKLEKDGVEYKFEYWTVEGDLNETPFVFNQPVEQSFNLIPVYSINTQEDVLVNQEDEVREEFEYEHDYVSDLQELVDTQNRFVSSTEDIENKYTSDTYRSFENNLIASEELLKQNPDNALCRVQYNLLSEARFNLVERSLDVEIIDEPVHEEVVEEIVQEVVEEPVQEACEHEEQHLSIHEIIIDQPKQAEEVCEQECLNDVEIVEEALVEENVETVETSQDETVEVEPKQFYKVLETEEEPTVEAPMASSNNIYGKTIVNNYYYGNGPAQQFGPHQAPNFDNLKLNASSYHIQDKALENYEQLTGEKIEKVPTDCDCLYTHKRDWLFMIFAFFVLIAIAVAIALIVYRLIVFWN